ncbi:catalase [Chloroflexia bacterium SDU3-3]|nr:catalase [Chloroflexia bacterium SDU3-3]
MSDDVIKPTQKDADLAAFTSADDQPMTTNQGQPVGDDQNSLRAGPRGPTLLEDYILREKIQHFDHERIPERVVHARGAAAHGYFELSTSLAQYTTASVLTQVGKRTPAFVRFSTVAGSRGSADTARDVRGFAVKLYTDEGNWDLVGNNIPVFFIQDAIKFPDLVHAVKPEPHNEIPQAASAHDTFYDFISLTPESMHMLMWIMSDRAIPRSYAMMEGFGVHTFRLINAAGDSTFVKFHWKPVLGAHSLVWDEAQIIAGKDPDFHRRDMWESIAQGRPLEWQLGVQLLADGEEGKLDFDILDATKLWPEDLFPVQIVGKLVLNRNPDNYFAETEQVAFMTTNIVPGIDFSDDPLLQGRNFSYMDTQLSRLGSPNFPELPINRPVAAVANNQRDAHMRTTINKGRVSYAPASLDGHSPDEVTNQRGFASYPAPVGGPKVRVRSESFGDHYGQARLFWNSMTPVEREHIVKALQFELSKVETREVRVRMLDHLHTINPTLGAQVALALGERPASGGPLAPPDGTADSAAEIAALASATSPTSASGGLQHTGGLSLEQGQPSVAKGRRVAILAAGGTSAAQVQAIQAALSAEGAIGEVVGPHLGPLGGEAGVEATKTLANTSSVLFDAVAVPGGAQGIAALRKMGDARAFIDQAFKHGKPIAALAEGTDLFAATETARLLHGEKDLSGYGVFVDQGGQPTTITSFVAALAQHRFRNRSQADQIAA